MYSYKSLTSIVARYGSFSTMHSQHYELRQTLFKVNGKGASSSIATILKSRKYVFVFMWCLHQIIIQHSLHQLSHLFPVSTLNSSSPFLVTPTLYPSFPCNLSYIPSKPVNQSYINQSLSSTPNNSITSPNLRPSRSASKLNNPIPTSLISLYR